MKSEDWDSLSDADKLKDIKTRFQGHKDKISRCKKRLENDLYIAEGTYFLLNNFRDDFSDKLILNFGRIQEIEDPPDYESLTSALEIESKHLGGNLVGFAQEAKFELFISAEALEKNPDLLFYFTALLRIKTGENFVVSFGASKSWSTIMGVENSTISIIVNEEVDKVWKFGKSNHITLEDIQWVNDKMDIFRELCQNEHFSTAIESYTTFNHISNLRMATALIWAGIESLFEVNQEITFRLSTIIASFLYERGNERYEFYRKLRKMYGFRSRAVHGSKIKTEQVYEHLDNTKDIFRAILTRIVNDGKLYSREEFEKSIFI
ncbi:hypothetical protein D5F11_007175 [Siminovitchia terrae]|uniref:Uncharacterized protein n=1 Tax=Siminovitchia terrae TaxID=1914933 RepID=A0A429X9Z7_SIMTE|nr:HEPN domain-containing protein [Siminovitchia terrae]RST60230.1 hypothetical protein D5F11_007175 [Siminovitchia terrae]